jgi:hypothetical protein
MVARRRFDGVSEDLGYSLMGNFVVLRHIWRPFGFLILDCATDVLSSTISPRLTSHPSNC